MKFDRTAWAMYGSTVLFVLLWSSGGIFSRLGLDHASAFAFLVLRFALACGVLVAIGVWRKRLLPAPGTRARIAAVGLLMIGGYSSCYFLALEYGITPGVLATVLGVQPILTLVILERRAFRPGAHSAISVSEPTGLGERIARDEESALGGETALRDGVALDDGPALSGRMALSKRTVLGGATTLGEGSAIGEETPLGQAPATARGTFPLKRLLGLMLALGGLVLLVYQSIGLARFSVMGMLCALAALASVTAGAILQKRVTQSPAAVLPLQYAVSLLLCCLVLPLQPFEVEYSTAFLIPLIWLGVVISVVAQLLLYHLIRVGNLVNVTSLFYLVPVVTAAMDYAFLGNRLSTLSLAGMVGILAGLALVFRTG